MPDIEVPQLALPFRFDRGTPAVVEQDSPEDIEMCAEAVLRCPTGFREELPEFGRPPLAFAQAPLDTARLRAAVDRWEDRADPESAERPDPFDAAVRRVTTDLGAVGRA